MHLVRSTLLYPYVQHIAYIGCCTCFHAIFFFWEENQFDCSRNPADRITRGYTRSAFNTIGSLGVSISLYLWQDGKTCIRKRYNINDRRIELQDLFIVDKFQLGDIADRGQAPWWIGLAGPLGSEDLDGVKPLYFNTKRSSEENRIKKRNNGIDGEFILHMYLNISIPEEIRENTLQILNDVATEVKDTEISYVHKYSEYQNTRISDRS
jgi:hypothetical protein